MGKSSLSLTLAGDGEQVRAACAAGGQGGSHLAADELERLLDNLY